MISDFRSYGSDNWQIWLT